MTGSTPAPDDTLRQAMVAVRDQASRPDFAVVFRYFAPRIRAYLIRSGASAAQADEWLQDTMATVWQKARLYDETRASVATWIYTIARNKRVDALRRERRPEPDEIGHWAPEADPDASDTLALAQESSRLRSALQQLPADQRDLVERAYFGDLSHSQIAADTGLPLGTIKSRIRLGLDRLRHAMSTSR